jgi:uncharacterized surface protein with fasciclin (FAS1) repeats
MVSIGPYSQATNYTHTFDIPDLRGPLPKRTFREGTLSCVIENHPDFSMFRHIVNTAQLENIYDDLQANMTVFVPSDQQLRAKGIDVTNLDIGSARNIVNASSLNRRITRDILEDSPASYFLTRNPNIRLFISNINDRTYINNNVNIIHKDMLCTNGIIHVIDSMLISPM